MTEEYELLEWRLKAAEAAEAEEEAKVEKELELDVGVDVGAELLYNADTVVNHRALSCDDVYDRRCAA